MPRRGGRAPRSEGDRGACRRPGCGGSASLCGDGPDEGSVRTASAPGDRRPAGTAATATLIYDVIIVGAGHNGLVAAAYLARAGRRVPLLQRPEVVGGGCVNRQPWA